MTGVVFVRPALGPKFAYNDTSTAFDREYVMFLSEVWAEAHWDDAHIQLPDWTNYKPDFWLLNGRVYPDTLAPNGIGNDPTGDLNAPVGSPHLQRQPISSLVQANAGEKVLLRFVNLGYQKQAMTLPGIKMNVIAKDATLLKNGSADMSYLTNTISIGPGESVDAIFTAPAVTSNTTYLLYNREYDHLNNAGGIGYGGQMTEVRIQPTGVPAQTDGPNT
jgi:FtsP/CotA-like multicopper oxidase with cupredoxin domain